METLQHRLAAVWFADIVGYTEQSAEDEGGALRTVQSFQHASRDIVRRHGGRIVKFIGDAAMAEFGSTEAAVRAAAGLPAACAEHASRTGVTCPTLRIAVHVGDVATASDDDLYGDGVNVAARIVKEVAPGEVWVSEDVYRQLRRRPAFRFEERGGLDLKGVGSLRAWCVAGVEGGGAGAFPATFVGRARARLAEAQGRRPYRAAVAAVVVLAAFVAAWLVLGRGGQGGGGGVERAGMLDPARIAVLYFQDRTPDSTSAHLAGGFTEAIIDQLASVEGLEVISRHGVLPFRGGRAPMDSIARALGAGTIVDGAVERLGDQLRVRVRMLDPAEGRQIATWTEERPWSELIPLQSAIADDIVVALRQRLGERLRSATRRSATTNAEAWESVEQAERLMQQARASDAADRPLVTSLYQQADQLLARAEGMDPGWVEPSVVRAEIAAYLGGEEEYRRGIDLATAALRREPRSARALAVRGALYDSLASLAADSVTIARNMAQAQRDLRTAVAIDPGLAAAWIALADLLYNDLWDLAEAREAARRAYEADAFLLEHDHFAWLCEISMQLKDFEEALRWCEEGRRRFPQRAQRMLLVELTVLASEGIEPDPPRAWRLVDETSRLSDADFNTPFAQMVAAAVLMRAGLADSAQAVARRANAAAPEGYAAYMAYLESYVQLLGRNRADALRLLEIFLTTWPFYRYQIANDHWYDRLDGDADFEALVERRYRPIFCRLLCEEPR